MNHPAKPRESGRIAKEDPMGWRAKPRKGGSTGDLIENILGRTSLFRGDLSADGSFRIDGWLEGSIESRAMVVIGESGAVRGNVIGTEIVVAGQIFGNVTCSGHLEILATGKVEGDIDAKSVRIETGGVFRGTSHMKGEAPTTVHEALGEVPAYETEISTAA
jgi:cytoskeletal protein CcmA (bactofilin family)